MYPLAPERFNAKQECKMRYPYLVQVRVPGSFRTLSIFNNSKDYPGRFHNCRIDDTLMVTYRTGTSTGWPDDVRIKDYYPTQPPAARRRDRTCPLKSVLGGWERNTVPVPGRINACFGCFVGPRRKRFRYISYIITVCIRNPVAAGRLTSSTDRSFLSGLCVVAFAEQGNEGPSRKQTTRSGSRGPPGNAPRRMYIAPHPSGLDR